MTRILVAEDSRTQAVHIRYLLEQAGMEVELVYDGRQALEAIERQLPDVVLTDLQMPELDGLQLVEAIRSRHPALPVLLMTGEGSEDYALEALRRGAVSYIPKTELQRGIARTLRHVLAVAKAVSDHPTLRRCLVQSEFHLQLDNDVALVPPIVAFFEEQLLRVNFCDRTGIVQVAIALTEALENAIYRGNLEIAPDLHEEDGVPFFQLVEQRREQPPYRDRHVQLRASILPGEAVFIVGDAGPGFDVSQIPNPADLTDVTRVRGLLLIQNFMSRVQFNDKGNELTMVKRRDLAV